MLEYFKSVVDKTASFQIECFYHQNRKKTEREIQTFLEQAGGEKISRFIDMSDIAFHAIKACMPVARIKTLLGGSEEEAENHHLGTSNNSFLNQE